MTKAFNEETRNIMKSQMREFVKYNNLKNEIDKTAKQYSFYYLVQVLNKTFEKHPTGSDIERNFYYGFLFRDFLEQENFSGNNIKFTEKRINKFVEDVIQHTIYNSKS